MVLYRSVFTVGTALIRILSGNDANLPANVLTDYSYVNARSGTITQGVQIARCVTGLGPSNNKNNTALGGLYFDGSRIPFVPCSDSSSSIIQPIPDANLAGVINIVQCRKFSVSEEGVYTCVILNSSRIYQSIRLGVYFTRRSESHELFIVSLSHLLSLRTAPPVIDTPSSYTVTVSRGFLLTLSCTSRGSPPDTFTWRKDNDPTVLQSTSITAVRHTSTRAVFHADHIINSFTISDIGTYTCTVTNPIGSDSATITVIGKFFMTRRCRKEIILWVVIR